MFQWLRSRWTRKSMKTTSGKQLPFNECYEYNTTRDSERQVYFVQFNFIMKIWIASCHTMTLAQRKTRSFHENTQAEVAMIPRSKFQKAGIIMRDVKRRCRHMRNLNVGLGHGRSMSGRRLNIHCWSSSNVSFLTSIFIRSLDSIAIGEKITIANGVQL